MTDYLSTTSVGVIAIWAVWCALSHKVRDGVVGKIIYGVIAIAGYAIVSRSENIFFSPSVAGVTFHSGLAMAGLRHYFIVNHWSAVKVWLCTYLHCEQCLSAKDLARANEGKTMPDENEMTAADLQAGLAGIAPVVIAEVAAAAPALVAEAVAPTSTAPAAETVVQALAPVGDALAGIAATAAEAELLKAAGPAAPIVAAVVNTDTLKAILLALGHNLEPVWEQAIALTKKAL